MSTSPSLPPEVPTRSLAPPLIAVALALAVVGALVWNLMRSGPDADSSSPGKEGLGRESPHALEPTRVATPEAEPPPPPPPPAEEAAAAPVRPGVAVPRGPDGPELSPQTPPPGRDPSCQAPCDGKETPELLRALRATAARARSCYEKALSNDSALAGRLEVGMRVSPTGSACSASIGKNGLGNAAVASCVLSRFQSGTYPKPSGGCVDVVVPMNFMPQGSR